MKSCHWMVICISWSILAIIILTLHVVNGELTRGPDDVLVNVGSTVTLPCSTNLSVPVQWEFKRYGAVLNEPWALVYFGYPTSHITPQFRKENTHSVSVDSRGNEYNLTIINLKTSDAGTYRCIDDYGFGSHKHDEGIPHHEYRAEVIAIDDNMTCYQSINESHVNTTRITISEEVVIRINCVFKYRGKFNPKLIWSLHMEKAGVNISQHSPNSVNRVWSENSYTNLISDLEINSTDIVSGSYIRCSLTTHTKVLNPVMSRNTSQIYWISSILDLKHVHKFNKNDSQNVSVDDETFSAVRVGLIVGLSVLLGGFLLIFCSRKRRSKDPDVEGYLENDEQNAQRVFDNFSPPDNVVYLLRKKSKLENAENENGIQQVSDNFSPPDNVALSTEEETEEMSLITHGAHELGDNKISRQIFSVVSVYGAQPEEEENTGLITSEYTTSEYQYVMNDEGVPNSPLYDNQNTSRPCYSSSEDENLDNCQKNLPIIWSDALDTNEVDNYELDKVFDDSQMLTADCSLDQLHITKVTLYLTRYLERDVIGAIEIGYKNGATEFTRKHGIIGDKPLSVKSFSLEEDEKIITIVAQCVYPKLMIASLKFKTNKTRSYGRYGSYYKGEGHFEIERHSLSACLVFMKGKVMKHKSETIIKHLQFGLVHSKDTCFGDMTSACTSLKQTAISIEGKRNFSISEKTELDWSDALATHEVKGFELIEEFNDFITFSSHSLGSIFITQVTIYFIHWIEYKIDIISAIRIGYNNGTTIDHGIIGDKPESVNSFTLERDDRITTVVVQCGWLIDSLKFKTEKKHSYGPYGGSGGGRVKIERKSLSGYLAFVKGRVMKCQDGTAIQHLQFGWVCSADKNNSDTFAVLYRQPSVDSLSSFGDDSFCSDLENILEEEILDVEWSKALATDSVDNYILQEEFDDSVMLKTSGDKFYISNVTLYLTRWIERDVIGAIKITYSNGTTVQHGTIDSRPGSLNSFDLQEDERIKSVTVQSGLLIDSLGFKTNKSCSYGPYGGSGGERYKVKRHSSSAYLLFTKGAVFTYKSDTVIKHLQFGWVYSKASS